MVFHGCSTQNPNKTGVFHSSANELFHSQKTSKRRADFRLITHKINRSMLALLCIWIGIFSTVFCSAGAEPVIESLPRIPPTSPQEALAKFKVRDGFELQLVAAEPDVLDPIAMAFDEFGRLFVVEMRDYSERRDERLGRIRLLEDTDADGYFEKSSIYVENLPWPTAVICYKGGIFVGSTPDIIFFRDTNGDGRADYRQVVFTGFGNTQTRLNVQQLLNSFQWGIDNRIHGASGANGGRITVPGRPTQAPLDLQNADFSFNPLTLDIRRENGGGQYGMSFDSRGRKFVCSNSSHIRMHVFERNWLDLNPFYSPKSPIIDIPADGPAAEVFRISPDEPWRVIRTEWRVKGLVPGPIEGGGRASGYFTAATGITIYKGDVFGPDFLGDAFIADCGSNLIHRKKLHPKGPELVAKRAPDEERSEFAASPDNWFRPVAFANAPDGTVFVADMYRETIEHPWSLPPNLKKHLDLNSGNDRGRIYRIAPKKFLPARRPLPNRKEPARLIQFLNHANGWHRETAARLITETINPRFEQPLRQAFARTTQPEGRIRLLYLLANNKWLRDDDTQKALSDTDGGVREHALKLVTNPGLLNDRLAKDPDARVRMQLGLAAAKVTASSDLLVTLSQSMPPDPWVDEALLIAAKENSLELATSLFNSGHTRLLPVLYASAAQSSTPEQLNTFLSANSTNLQVASYFSAGLRKRNMGLAQFPFGRQVLDFAKVAALNASMPQRLAAISLLSELPFAQAAPLLNGLLSEQNPIQERALSALGEFENAEVARLLVANWEEFAAANKQKALELLTRREAWALELLNSDLRAYVTAAQRQALLSFPSPQVSQRAKAVFPSSAIQTNNAKSLQLTGDSRVGATIFNERCASCHKVGNIGYNLGPDLNSVRSNGREAILRAILQPDLELSPLYIQYTIATADNEVLTGLVTDQSNNSITVRGPNGWQETLPRSQVLSVKSNRKSIMPEGLLEGLTNQQIADLLEFIMSAK